MSFCFLLAALLAVIAQSMIAITTGKTHHSSPPTNEWDSNSATANVDSIVFACQSWCFLVYCCRGVAGFLVGVGIDSADNVWAADFQKLYKFTSDGHSLGVLGSNQFSHAYGVSIDQTSGNIWAIDAGFRQ